MSHNVHIRRNNRDFQFEVDDQVDLWTGGPRGSAISSEVGGSDFAAAVCYALQHPTDYPPISGGVVPGDAVAIVVDVEVPSPAEAVAGVLRALESLELSRIDVVIGESASEATRKQLRESLPQHVDLTVHSGKSRDDLRYLAANEAADPIYLNRRIVDADLVIPIEVMRKNDPLLAGSTSNAVFPTLSDHRSQARARIGAADVHASLKKRRKAAADDEASRVGWLLGLQWLVQVEVTADGMPAAVHVGTSETLAAHQDDASSDAHAPFAGDVVIACVDGSEQQQSLVNLLRAALVARKHASSEASIVLVSDIGELGVIAETGDDYEEDEEAEQERLNAARGERSDESSDDDRGDDDQSDDDTRGGSNRAQDATLEGAIVDSPEEHARKILHELVNDLDSPHRYLLFSNCNEEEAEGFGFGVIQDEHSLQRLVNGHDSCLVLRMAQLASTIAAPGNASASPTDSRSGRRSL